MRQPEENIVLLGKRPPDYVMEEPDAPAKRATNAASTNTPSLLQNPPFNPEIPHQNGPLYLPDLFLPKGITVG